MRPETNAQIVQRLFLATGRKPELGTFAVWEEALDGLQDEPALEAAMQVIKTVDMTYGPPSPVMVRDAYQAIMRRRDSEQPALVEETNPVVADAAARKAGLEEAMAALRRHQRLPSDEAHPRVPDPLDKPKLKTDAHSMGDHQFCMSDCPDRPQEEPAEPASDEPEAGE